MAVSSSSMKVARVTVTAMIQGLTARRPHTGQEWKPLWSSYRCRPLLDATRDRSVASNFWYNAISDQLVAELVSRDLNAQRRADAAGHHSQGGPDLQPAGLRRSRPIRSDEGNRPRKRRDLPALLQQRGAGCRGF